MAPVSRRTLLVAGGVGVLGVGGAAAVASGAVPVPARVRRIFAEPAVSGPVPDVPLGRERLEQVASRARGRTVGFWTAVPAGHGDGRGLPVCLVLHGASATTADFSRFGLGRFLTAAVRVGVPPFGWALSSAAMSGWLADSGVGGTS